MCYVHTYIVHVCNRNTLALDIASTTASVCAYMIYAFCLSGEWIYITRHNQCDGCGGADLLICAHVLVALRIAPLHSDESNNTFVW